MMKKKYIISAVILCFVVIFFSNMIGTEGDSDLPRQCMDRIVPYGLYLAGMQGGLELGESLPVGEWRVNYAYLEGKDKHVTLGELESQYREYIRQAAYECTGDYDDITVNIDFGDESVDILVGLSDRTMDFSYPVRLAYIHSVVREIITLEILNPESVDLYVLSEMGVNVSVVPYGEDTILYVLIDDNSTLYDKSYTYMFANKFNLDRRTETKLIGKIPDQKLVIGKKMVIDIPDYDSGIRYEVSSPLNHKIADGKLEIIGDRTGNYTIYIAAIQEEDTGLAMFNIEVKDE